MTIDSLQVPITVLLSAGQPWIGQRPSPKGARAESVRSTKATVKADRTSSRTEALAKPDIVKNAATATASSSTLQRPADIEVAEQTRSQRVGSSSFLVRIESMLRKIPIAPNNRLSIWNLGDGLSFRMFQAKCLSR